MNEIDTYLVENTGDPLADLPTNRAETGEEMAARLTREAAARVETESRRIQWHIDNRTPQGIRLIGRINMAAILNNHAAHRDRVAAGKGVA